VATAFRRADGGMTRVPKSGTPGVGDIARNYAAAKSREEWYGEWGAALLYRPISFVITPLFLRLSISATSVTGVALVLVMSLPLLALQGATAYWTVGVTAVLIAILDCVDGNIARLTETVSKIGHYLDFLTDILFRVALYCAIGMISDSASGVPAWIAGNGLGVGAAAAFLAVGARLCRIYAERFAGEVAYGRPSESESPSAGGIARYVFPFISGMDPLLPLIVLLAGYFGGLGWVLAWLLAYSTLDFLYTQFAVIKRIA